MVLIILFWFFNVYSVDKSFTILYENLINDEYINL